MKTESGSRWMFAALLVLSAGTSLAEAFYEPSLGRWLNRDPVEEITFQKRNKSHRSSYYASRNPYWFVANAPANKLDSWGLEITFVGCGEEDKEAIKKAIKDNCDKAKTCAGCYQGAAAVNDICSSDPNVTISCADPGDPDCAGNCGIGITGSPYQKLCPDAWDPQKCGPLACTVFHESLHNGGMRDGPSIDDFERCMGCK